MESSVKSLLRKATRQLGEPVASARLDAEVLLAHCMGVPRSYLYAWPERKVTTEVGERLAEMLARRAHGEPLAYLVGEKEFWSLTFAVNPKTLIPRPETELLVAETLARCPPAAHILELGTGSGAIAIALGHELPDARIVATEVSAGALAVASENAARLGVANVSFVKADADTEWFGAVPVGHFDVLVANPPYVADNDPGFRTGGIRFEPRRALAAGRDGLRDLAAIVAGAPACLAAGGWLLLEHGSGQGAAVAQMMGGAGFRDVATLPDLAGLARVTIGRKRSP